MRYFLLIFFGIFLLSPTVKAACPAAPVGSTSDTVIQMKAIGGNAGMGPTSALDATEEGAMVYDDTNDTVKVCDGTNWVELGGSGGGGNSNATFWEYTTAGTYAWTKPSSGNIAQVECWGGGGGGGGSGGTNTMVAPGGSGGSGGAGGAEKNWFNLSALSSEVTVTIGTSGVGGAGGYQKNYGTAGTAGTASSFGGYLVLSGGGGGGGGQPNSFGSAKGAAGTAYDRYLLDPYGKGGAGGLGISDWHVPGGNGGNGTSGMCRIVVF